METTGLLQKILGSILALILVLGIFPVGLLYFSTPVIAEDSLIRLAPAAETFVYRDDNGSSRESLDRTGLVVGNYWNTYFKFDLTSLGNIKRADLKNARLRLAVLDNGAVLPNDTDCTFNVSYVNNNSWNEAMTWSCKPMGEEQYICTATGGKAGEVLEIDISEFIRSTAGFDDKVITIKLSPSLSNNAPVRLASSRSADPSLRPYLKVLTGDVTDSDPAKLRKAYLMSDGYTSAVYPEAAPEELRDRNNGFLAVDNGSAAYLTFGLDLRNITGAVYSAALVLRPRPGSFNTLIDIYCLPEDGSTEKGTFIRRLNGIETDGELRIDVTDCVYEAVSAGKTRICFAVDGTSTPAESTDTTEIYSSAFPELEPRLEILNTDDRHIVALREAIPNLKGSNSSLDNVTDDLPDEYIASNGERVTIRWGGKLSLESLLRLERSVVSAGGRITRPSRFDGARSVNVMVVLTCGGQTLERFENLTIRPEGGETGRSLPLYKALW